MTIAATYFGANSWLLEFDSIRMLIDPWFKGNLEFRPFTFILKGTHKNQPLIPDNLDLILLTQGLPDHSHKETLQEFSKEIEIFASKSASRVLEELKFKNINIIPHGELRKYKEVCIRSFKGAPVPLPENGYLIKYNGYSIYIEPHGYTDENLGSIDIDTIISPVIDIKIPLIGNIIRGSSIISELEKRHSPKNILASTTGGDIIYSGLFSKLMKVVGDMNKRPSNISKSTNYINPILGKKYILT